MFESCVRILPGSRTYQRGNHATSGTLPGVQPIDIVPVQKSKCNPVVGCRYPGAAFDIFWINSPTTAIFIYSRRRRASSGNLLIAIHAQEVTVSVWDKSQCAHSVSQRRDMPWTCSCRNSNPSK